MKKQKQPIQVYTCKIRRAIAKKNMQNEGIKQMNKTRFATNPKTGLVSKSGSLYAELWRKYVYPVKSRRKKG